MHGFHNRPAIIQFAASVVTVCLFVWVGAACSSSTPTPVVQQAATSTLIPPTNTPLPTATFTPVPITPLPGPDDLPTYTPAVLSFLPASASVATQNAMADLREQLGIGEDPVIGVLNLRRVNWPDGKLGCAREVISEILRGEDGVPGYRVALNIEDEGYVYHTDVEGVVVWCRQEDDFFSDEGEPLAFDPIGESLIGIAQADLAQRLEIDPSRIQWVDFSVVTWVDSSLGCPRPDLNYTVANIPGYRILFQVDVPDENEPENTEIETHIYHSDGLEVDYCEAERELLPPPYRPIEEIILDPATEIVETPTP